MELNSRIKDGLIKINFVKRYEELSKRFDAVRTPENERLIYIDGDEVMEMIQKFGYIPQFDSKEKFYKIKEEQIEQFSFGVHIALRDGTVELIWVVRENGEVLLGSPWAIYSRLLIDANYRIKRPIIGTYDDIEEILKISFEMYEDFKRALINV